MENKTRTHLKNNLWRARRRAGLERKQVAFLLKRKTADEISRYEKGIYQPNLHTALKLEIIYRVPIRLLFRELFECYRDEIAEIRKQHPQLFADKTQFSGHSEQLKEEESCFYAEELLKGNVPNELELKTVEKHVVNLMRLVNDYRSGRHPLSLSKSN